MPQIAMKVPFPGISGSLVVCQTQQKAQAQFRPESPPSQTWGCRGRRALRYDAAAEVGSSGRLLGSPANDCTPWGPETLKPC